MRCKCLLATLALAAAGAPAALASTAVVASRVGGSRALLAPAPANGPRSSSGESYRDTDSYNWSGYVQSSSAARLLKGVSGTWTIPTVDASQPGSNYESDWVGIGGFGSDDLVQCGTQGENDNGAVHYAAWTEILPAAEDELSLAVHPGDEVKSWVEETATNTWLMEVDDLTTGQSASRTVSYDSSGSSAEVVHERPEVGGSLANEAETNNVPFDPNKFTITAPGKPKRPWLPFMTAESDLSLWRVFMMNNGDTAIIAAPSAPDSDNDGFTVAYGATAPPPPSS